MEKSKTIFVRILKILKWAFFILLGSFILFTIARIPSFFKEKKTEDQVYKIHSTKLQLSDVMGENLPPDPGAEADKTVQGIDANNNGIRDDVELAVFKEYPKSAKKRAVSLQYAMALQRQTTQRIFNTETVVATIQEEDRAYQCIGEILPKDLDNEKIMDKYFQNAELLTVFVKDRHLNTEERKNYRADFYKKIGSYNSLERICDIDYSKLPN